MTNEIRGLSSEEGDVSVTRGSTHSNPYAPGGAGGGKCNLMIVASTLWNGGAETVIRHLAHAVNRRQFNVTVCHLKERGDVGDRLCLEGIDIIGLPRPTDSKPDYLTFLKLLKVIRTKQIDVVHTHTAHGLVDSCLCKLFRPRLRVVHTFHFGNYPQINTLQSGHRIMWMECIFSRFADQLIAVGEVQRRQIQDLYGFSDRRIRTIRNGVAICPVSGDLEFRRQGGGGKLCADRDDHDVD